MFTAIKTFLVGNKTSVIIFAVMVAVFSTVLYMQSIQINSLKSSIGTKDTEISTLNSELATYKSALNEQRDENKNLTTKVEQLQSTYAEVKKANGLLVLEIAEINNRTLDISNKLASFETRMTDTMMHSKPYMLQKRIRTASLRAYQELQQTSVGE